MSRHAIGLGLLALGLPLRAQTVRHYTLAPATARLDAGFGVVFSLRELRDGRVLLREKSYGVAVVDFKTGTATQVARAGRGPTEYGGASFNFVPLGGDSTALVDAGAYSYLLFVAAKPVKTITAATDSALRHIGQWQYSSRRYVIFGGGVSPDSGWYVLMDRHTAAMDTIAYVHSEEYLGLQAITLGSAESSVLFDDDWVGIARLHPYRVDWRMPSGKWRHGKALPFRSVTIDDRQKAAYNELLKKQGYHPRSLGMPWAHAFPPFDPYRWIRGSAAPDGRLVIPKPTIATETDSVSYDIVNRNGELDGRLVLGPAERILGFGKSSVYVVEQDSTGVEWLRRHPWPPMKRGKR